VPATELQITPIQNIENSLDTPNFFQRVSQILDPTPTLSKTVDTFIEHEHHTPRTVDTFVETPITQTDAISHHTSETPIIETDSLTPHTSETVDTFVETPIIETDAIPHHTSEIVDTFVETPIIETDSLTPHTSEIVDTFVETPIIETDTPSHTSETHASNETFVENVNDNVFETSDNNISLTDKKPRYMIDKIHDILGVNMYKNDFKDPQKKKKLKRFLLLKSSN